MLITNGCMEAVSLALQALVKPGQVVAVESPTHFGFLQLLREMGLYGVAVPTDPRLGLDPAALERILGPLPGGRGVDHTQLPQSPWARSCPRREKRSWSG